MRVILAVAVEIESHFYCVTSPVKKQQNSKIFVTFNAYLNQHCYITKCNPKSHELNLKCLR